MVEDRHAIVRRNLLDQIIFETDIFEHDSKVGLFVVAIDVREAPEDGGYRFPVIEVEVWNVL